jgi:hypothetical protein
MADAHIAQAGNPNMVMSINWNRLLPTGITCAALLILSTAALAAPVNGTLQLGGTLAISSTR